MASKVIKDGYIQIESDFSYLEIYEFLINLRDIDPYSIKGIIWNLSDKVSMINLDQLEELEKVVCSIGAKTINISKIAIIIPNYYKFSYGAALDLLFSNIKKSPFQIKRFGRFTSAQEWIWSE